MPPRAMSLSPMQRFFPKVIQPNVLVCLTQADYNKYTPMIRPGRLFITDSRYVKIEKKMDAHQVELPIYETVMAKLGKAIMFNIFMLGAFIELTQLVQPEAF